MQFLDRGRYVANVVDGEVNFYGRKQRSGRCIAMRWVGHSAGPRPFVAGLEQAFRTQSLLGVSRFNLPVILLHGIIPLLKFGVGQQLYIGVRDDAASFVHRVNDGCIYSRIACSLQ